MCVTGDHDPWSAGGSLTDISDTVIAIIVEGGHHHVDLRSSDPADTPSIIAARQREVELIRQFINNPAPNNACDNKGEETHTH